MRRHLRDGALAGLAGGAALALVLLLAGEGAIGQAVALERRSHPGAASDEMFSRGTQQAGGAFAAVIWGLALGLIFAVVFVAVRRGRSGPPALEAAKSPSDWRAAVFLAGLGFLTVNLVPFLKYPANPPGVGDPSTIGRRSALYLLMMAWSLIATAAAWRAGRLLAAGGVPEHLRLPAVVLLYAVLVVTGLVALPGSPDPVPAPATLVWRFRLASLGGMAAFWATCGTVFGWLRLAAAGQAPFSPLTGAGLRHRGR